MAVVISTAELAGVSTRSLGDKVTPLKSKRDEIIAALGLLFTGYDAALRRVEVDVLLLAPPPLAQQCC